jgi:hypothetical protein
MLVMTASIFVCLIKNAVMTFEDEKLQEAMQVLKDMEKRCAQDMGWMKTVKNKVFGAASAVRILTYTHKNWVAKLM